MTSSFSISASEKVRARCNFLGKNSSTSAIYVIVTVDDPKILEENTGVKFIKEHEMTPDILINERKGIEKSVFKRVFAGKFSKKLYRLYEFAGGSAYGR